VYAYEAYEKRHSVKWMNDDEWGTVISAAHETSIAGNMYAFSPMPGYTDQFDQRHLGQFEISVDHSNDNAYSVSMSALQDYWIEEVKFASVDETPNANELKAFTETTTGADGYPPHVFDLSDDKPANFQETCLRSFLRDGNDSWKYCQANEPYCDGSRRLKGRARDLSDGTCYSNHKLLLRARICTVDDGSVYYY
jgi:hypothetical protein